jgi:hypothetical protein
MHVRCFIFHLVAMERNLQFHTKHLIIPHTSILFAPQYSVANRFATEIFTSNFI